MEWVLYGLLALFALGVGGAIWRNFRALRGEDKHRAQSMARTRTHRPYRSIPLGMESTGTNSVTPHKVWYQRAFGMSVSYQPQLDSAVNRQHQLARSLNPQKSIVHTTAAESAKRLVKGIARHNPVVIFMDGKADTTTDPNTRLLIDLLNSLKITFKDVDVPADPEMHLGLPEKRGNVDLPYIYVGGLAVGGLESVLAMAQSGALIDQLVKHNVSYDKTIAEGLVQKSEG